MKKRNMILLLCITIVVSICSVICVFPTGANANKTAMGNYTITDLKYLRNFLLNRETDDLSKKNYDLNDDGVWNVSDLCLMWHTLIKTPDAEAKTLVAYYSASGTTDRIAQFIAEELNADLFVITPVDEYTDADLDWMDSSSRVVTEHNNLNRHTELVTVTPENFDSYDNVFIGYPIWWQEAAWVVNDFVTENDFTGKNVIPFCTSMSSPLGESGTKLAEMAGTGNWLEGMRFTSHSSQKQVQEWVSSLELSKPNIKGNTLVAYFSPADNGEKDAVSSATLTVYQGEDMGAAEVLANMIAENTGADLFSIQTIVDYPLEYNDLANYAKSEQDNGVLPELAVQINNFEDYDTIYVVFPVWWYTMPQAVYSFFDAYDFSGKTIIPASTHAGSYLAGSPATIAELEPNAMVIQNGFSVSASRVVDAESDVIDWLNTLQ